MNRKDNLKETERKLRGKYVYNEVYGSFISVLIAAIKHPLSYSQLRVKSKQEMLNHFKV